MRLKRIKDSSFILLLAFLNVFAMSGAAELFNYNNVMAYLSIPLFLWGVNKRQQVIRFSLFEKTMYVLLLVVMILGILMEYNADASQLINLIVTFGFPLWCTLFARIPWEEHDFYKLGIYGGVLGILLCVLFLPGRSFSGWNPNSPILVVPILFFSLSCIACSNTSKKKRNLSMTIIFVSSVIVIELLGNRSSLLSIFLFAAFVVLYRQLTKRNLCWIALIIIALNVLIPYGYETINSMSLFDSLHDMASSMIEEKKEGGFNGREDLWTFSIWKIKENPFFGEFGVSPIYPHNLSIDLQLAFGWLGWLAFAWMAIVVLFRTFREHSPYNIFPLAFLCLVFLNTFENVLACCDYFVVFSYVLPAVALRMKYPKKVK